MTVQDVGSRFARTCGDVADRRDIGHPDVAGHRHSREAERQQPREFRERRLCLPPAARRIGNDADRVPARRLAAGEVADVPEQAADRRAQHVEDFQARRHFSDLPDSLTLSAACNGHGTNWCPNPCERAMHRRRQRMTSRD